MEKMMRRFRQQLDHENCIGILRSTTSGVLALCGEDMQPYGVPLSHVYADGKLYFHSALVGQKVDMIAENAKASYTVIAQDEIHPESFTTHYRSVIATGTVRIIEDKAGKMQALLLLGRRCSRDDEKGLTMEIARGFSRCLVLEMDIRGLSGKQAIELVRR